MPTVLVPAQFTVEHLMATVKQLSPALTPVLPSAQCFCQNDAYTLSDTNT